MPEETGMRFACNCYAPKHKDGILLPSHFAMIGAERYLQTVHGARGLKWDQYQVANAYLPMRCCPACGTPLVRVDDRQVAMEEPR